MSQRFRTVRGYRSLAKTKIEPVIIENHYEKKQYHRFPLSAMILTNYQNSKGGLDREPIKSKLII
jgi:hypothetical protein